jgi:DeoR/GlpR family transcriptional regulator of sugar metabolism
MMTPEQEQELQELVASVPYARILLKLKDLGASYRVIARKFRVSEATIRRDFATYDAIRSGNFHKLNGRNSGAASNDASPALQAFLKNLPKLTADERYVVRQQLDLLEDAP